MVLLPRGERNENDLSLSCGRDIHSPSPPRGGEKENIYFSPGGRRGKTVFPPGGAEGTRSISPLGAEDKHSISPLGEERHWDILPRGERKENDLSLPWERTAEKGGIARCARLSCSLGGTWFYHSPPQGR